MKHEDYSKHLGGLMGNFHSLEFALRAFLQGLPTARPIGIAYGVDIYSFPVGTELPENELTSFDSLKVLIGKFNTEMKSRQLPEIDIRLVEVRDALAHGRVSAASPEDNPRLLKFDKPINGRVRVVFNEELSEGWFVAQKKRVVEALRTVAKYCPQTNGVKNIFRRKKT